MIIKDYNHCIHTGQKRENSTYGVEQTLEQKEHSIKTSVSRTRQEIYKLIQNNTFHQFVTITVNPEVCNRYDDDQVLKKLKDKIFDIIRKEDKKFKYINIPERHKDGALHFHMLCTNSEKIQLVSRNETDRSGREIFTAGIFEKLGRTTITIVDNQESAKKYITKYITKSSLEHTKCKKRYYGSRNLEKPLERKIHLVDEDKKIVVQSMVKDYTIQSCKTVAIPKMNNSINIYSIAPIKP